MIKKKKKIERILNEIYCYKVDVRSRTQMFEICNTIFLKMLALFAVSSNGRYSAIP